jgi:hypothetical protein
MVIKFRHVFKFLAGGFVFLPNVTVIVKYDDIPAWKRYLLNKLPRYFDLKVNSRNRFTGDEEVHGSGKFFFTKMYSLDKEIEDPAMLHHAEIYVREHGWSTPPK